MVQYVKGILYAGIENEYESQWIMWLQEIIISIMRRCINGKDLMIE